MIAKTFAIGIANTLALGLMAAVTATAQNYAQRFWFDDGAGVELHTQSTGANGTAELSRRVAVSPGTR